MKMLKKYRLQIFITTIGIVVGYLLFHPYTMLMHFLVNPQIHETGYHHVQWRDILTGLQDTFKPGMFPMAISFSIFGGVIGLLTGIIADRKKRLFAARLENEKRKASLDTLNRLMVTLSHYLLNANAVIGGMVRRSRKNNTDVQESIDIIEEEAKKIDTVISVLRSISEIKTADYTTAGKDLMIDITKEIEERLNKSEEMKEKRDS